MVFNSAFKGLMFDWKKNIVLKISGNKFLKKIFGPIVKQVTRKWFLYSLPN